MLYFLVFYFFNYWMHIPLYTIVFQLNFNSKIIDKVDNIIQKQKNVVTFPAFLNVIIRKNQSMSCK